MLVSVVFVPLDFTEIVVRLEASGYRWSQHQVLRGLA